MRVACATMLLLLVPASAESATLYAAPDGTGTACSPVSPCSLPSAVGQAQGGDTVSVGPGTYSGLRDQQVTNLLGIHLVGTRPRPLLRFEQGGVTVGGGTPDEEGVPGSVRHLDVETASGSAVTLGDGEIENVVARTPSSDAAACAIGQGRVLKSVCLSTGGIGVHVFGNEAVIGAVTALGATAGVSIDRPPDPGTTAQLDVHGTIARATDGNDIDTNTHDTPFGGNVAASTSYSNFGSGPSGVSNQSDPPVFLDDYHQAPSSPTVDALPLAPDASSDIDGDPRSAGPRRDIGADEYHAPSAVTDVADVLTAEAVDLRSRVDPHGPDGQVRFEYGETVSYGRSVEAGPVSGSGSRDVQARIAGLSASTTYHFRVVLTVGPTTVTGADRTFTTHAATPVTGGTPPPAATPPPLAAGTPAQPSFDFMLGVGRLRSGLPVRFTCSSACRVEVTLSISRATARRTGAGRRAMVVGRSSGSLTAAGRGSLRARLSTRVRRRLRRVRTLPVVVRIKCVTPADATSAFTAPAVLRR